MNTTTEKLTTILVHRPFYNFSNYSTDNCLLFFNVASFSRLLNFTSPYTIIYQSNADIKKKLLPLQRFRRIKILSIYYKENRKTKLSVTEITGLRVYIPLRT